MPAAVATVRGPFLSIQNPPMVDPIPRKKIASVNVSVTSVTFHSLFTLRSGMTKTLHAYTAPNANCMKMAAMTMDQRLVLVFNEPPFDSRVLPQSQAPIKLRHF